MDFRVPFSEEKNIFENHSKVLKKIYHLFVVFLLIHQPKLRFEDERKQKKLSIKTFSKKIVFKNL
jgi:hypothetical protein